MAQRVLIVDDHDMVRKPLRESFESEGFTCGEAENGAQAVKLAEELRPDLIVLDLSMPVMNGIEAAPLLRKILPQTPIIMFTMHASKELMQLAMGIGVSAVVSKAEAVTHVVRKAHALLKHSSASSKS